MAMPLQEATCSKASAGVEASPGLQKHRLFIGRAANTKL